MTWQQQLRVAYLESGRTMADIAAEAGVSENTAYRACGPRPRNLSADTALAIAAALNIAVIEVDSRRRTKI